MERAEPVDGEPQGGRLGPAPEPQLEHPGTLRPLRPRAGDRPLPGPGAGADSAGQCAAGAGFGALAGCTPRRPTRSSPTEEKPVTRVRPDRATPDRPGGRPRRAVALPALACLTLALLAARPAPPPPAEAESGYDGRTNGVSPQAELDLDRATFDEREEPEDGLGPTYNATSCGACHATPRSGGSSQVVELRAGHWRDGRYADHPGGGVVADRALDAAIQEHVLPSDTVLSLRLSTSILGDAYVEAVADSTLEAIAAHQPTAVRGLAVRVPVLEAGGAPAVGRFGWKDQHASLLSFAADAYLNEMGVTTELLPVENSSDGRPVDAFDAVVDPEDDGEDLDALVRFMRSSQAPPRDAARVDRPEVLAGETVFQQLGCAGCHLPDLVTAPAGTVVAAGAYTVPPALGHRVFHPYSDFLLHDVGTGDGVVQAGGAATRDLLRTAPLWGLRTRSHLMHDGLSLTVADAIRRHGGQARRATEAWQALPPDRRRQLLEFLASL